MSEIKSFDATSMNKEQMKLLQESKGDPDLDPERVEQSNKAAAGLAHWIKSLQDFAEVKATVNKQDAKDRRSMYNKAESAYPDATKASISNMNIPLRKIESEGNIPNESVQKSVASSKRGVNRKNTASYLAPTSSSVTKSASKKKVTKKNSIGVNKLDDLDISAVNNDGTRYNPEGLNLDET